MTKLFSIRPTILQFDNCTEFINHFEITKDDLIFTSKRCYKKYFENKNLDATVIFRDDYGSGEPSDEMVEAIWKDIEDVSFNRVFAIGGGTIIDVAKLFALEKCTPVVDLFYNKTITPKQTKELIIVPTTCGTGSEVTNISILELKSLSTKLGLAHDMLYPQYAVLIPELLDDLPMSVFATSSIDALIHACESFLSPKANAFTKVFSQEAIKMILSGYVKIVTDDLNSRLTLNKDFLIASTYAGIAFGNAGTGAVHAMSYPLGAKYHIPHGESNYTIFTEVFKTYQQKKPNGDILILNSIIADILKCSIDDVYNSLELLLNKLLPKKPLSYYGTTQEDLVDFTENVVTKQGRLTANNYVPLSKDEIFSIYSNLL